MKLLPALAPASCLALAFVVTACGSGTSTPSTPTTTAAPVTETFSANIDQSGSHVNTFTVGAAGEVDATFASETVSINGTAVASTIALGIVLGSWDGANCNPAVENDNSRPGTVLSGLTSTTGTFCVAVFDVGNITPGSPTTYTVTVTHP
jgi:hypothetical protein